MNSLPVLFCRLGFILAGSVVALQAQITEFTTTVEPGHFLLEMDALSLTVDREPGQKYTAWGAATTFLSTGLTANWDMQVGAEFFISQKVEGTTLRERQSGVGDVYIRTKWRFYESEEYYTTAAIMPYVKLPTNSGGVGNDAVEGGFIIPFQTKVLGGVDFIAMAELDFTRNDNDDGYDTYWFTSAAMSRQIMKVIGVYGEATAGKSSGVGEWAGTLGAGVTLRVSKYSWWDYSMHRGISDGAPDTTYVLRYNLGF